MNCERGVVNCAPKFFELKAELIINNSQFKK